MSDIEYVLFKYDDKIDTSRIIYEKKPKNPKSKKSNINIYYKNDKNQKCRILIQTPKLFSKFGIQTQHDFINYMKSQGKEQSVENREENKQDYNKYHIFINLKYEDENSEVAKFANTILNIENHLARSFSENYDKFLDVLQPHFSKLDVDSRSYLIYQNRMIITPKKEENTKYGNKIKFKLPTYKGKLTKNNEKANFNLKDPRTVTDKEIARDPSHKLHSEDILKYTKDENNCDAIDFSFNHKNMNLLSVIILDSATVLGDKIFTSWSINTLIVFPNEAKTKSISLIADNSLISDDNKSKSDNTTDKDNKTKDDSAISDEEDEEEGEYDEVDLENAN